MTTQENGGTVRHGDFYPGRLAAREFDRNRDSEIGPTFLMEIRQTGVVEKEFHVWAVTVNCNCKEVPINPINKSRTHYY
jgi:hypothetical protein